MHLSVMFKLTSQIAMVVLIGLMTACQNERPADSLTMLTAPDYCPYEFRAKQDNGKFELVGFDIDVAKAIADKLDLSLTIETRHFNQIMPALDQLQADFAMAAITPTSNRRQMVDFSAIYYTQSIAIVSRQIQPLTSLESLIQRTVGVKATSFQSQELTRYADISQIEFGTTDELIAAVKAQQVDAGILDQAIAPKYVTPASQLLWTPVESVADVAGVAIAFPKSFSPDVQRAINTALARLQQDGTMTKLIHEWFDIYQCPQD